METNILKKYYIRKFSVYTVLMYCVNIDCEYISWFIPKIIPMQFIVEYINSKGGGEVHNNGNLETIISFAQITFMKLFCAVN